MNCLWCDQEIILEISWENIFILPMPKQLCALCEGDLELLQGKRCHKCSRMTKDRICSDCASWSNDEQKDPLVSNYSIFTYNEQMQAMIAKWKYRGDYVLANAFKIHVSELFIKQFTHLTKNLIIVPIPLSKERIKERGFNQAKVLASFLPIKSQEIMTRVHSEKQSKKTRHERISTKNPFKVNGKVNKTVILVDDIYTTGTTLRHAASVLRKNGCPEVYAYTLIRG